MRTVPAINLGKPEETFNTDNFVGTFEGLDSATEGLQRSLKLS